jgi:hypothetical protein
MSLIIATSGKGSMGKTTFLIKSYENAVLDEVARQMRCTEIFIVDLDPYTTLTLALQQRDSQIPCVSTIGAKRGALELEMSSGTRARVPDGTPEMLEIERQIVSSCIATWHRDSMTYHLITLGTWLLGGSQCTPNNTLARTLEILVRQHPTAVFVMDNPAGIEPLGRYADVPAHIYLCFGHMKDPINRTAWANTLWHTAIMAWRNVLLSPAGQTYHLIAIPSLYPENEARTLQIDRKDIERMLADVRACLHTPNDTEPAEDLITLVAERIVVAPPFVLSRSSITNIWQTIHRTISGQNGETYVM